MRSRRKFLVILNPTAGKGRAARARPLIDGFLRGRGPDYEIVLTEKAGHALEIARDRLACYRRSDEETVIVAAGGDGTANEVANGILQASGQTGEQTSLEQASRQTSLEQAAEQTSLKQAGLPVMAVLPVGRGNDFASNAGVGEDLSAALETLVSGEALPLDAGLVIGGSFPRGRYFVNGLGIGFDCKVGFEAAKLRIKSGLSYAAGALITLAKFEPTPVIKVDYDGSTLTLDAALVSIMNGVRMGGVFIMGPDALTDDGLFDICMVRRPSSRLRLVKLILGYTKGRQGEFAETVFARARSFRLSALDGGMAAHCDGETVCVSGRELRVLCLPSAIRLLRPASFSPSAPLKHLDAPRAGLR